MQPGTPVPPFSLQVHVDAHIRDDAHIQKLTMFNASPALTVASTNCNVALQFPPPGNSSGQKPRRRIRLPKILSFAIGA